jgi:ATP-binding cassette, subfamily B, bacterial
MKYLTRKTFKFFWKHADRYRRWVILIAATVVFTSAMQMLWPIYLGQFFNVLATESDKAVAVPQLVDILKIIAIIGASEWVVWRIFDHSFVWLQARVMANINNECFEYMQGHSYRFFTDNFAGALVKKVGKLSRAFETIMDRFTFDLARITLKLIIITAVLSTYNTYIALGVVAWALLFIGMNYGLSVYKLKYDVAKSKADTKITASLADVITNNINIKLFSSLRDEFKRFVEVTEDWYRKTKKTWTLSVRIEGLQAFLMISLEILILFKVIDLWESDLLTVGMIFVIQAYLWDLFGQLWDFGRTVRHIYEALADAEEMTKILDDNHEVRDVRGAKELKIRAGKIKFTDVGFSYGKKNEKVIEGLTFKIKAGEKVALIGPSGGGKSTIFKLILRLFDIQKGDIVIDGQDISKVTQDSLRSEIALVPQDPILFHRSLMENIRYGRRDASDQAVYAAAKMAHCSEFIDRFPKGYDTLVGERGVKLSGGQKQRVAIARAILSNAKILMLDEATSSLDSESEELIQDALKNLMKNKTTLVIAHRLSTIMESDRILVLKDGKVIEDGQHADLINKKGSLYNKLWNLQVGGYKAA